MTTFRRLQLMLGLAACAALLIPAAPAHAAGEAITVCFEVGDDDDLEIWDCYQVVIPKVGPNPPGPIECLSCLPAIDIRVDLDQKRQWEFYAQFGQGLQLLGKEALAEDPAEAEQLRKQATESFLASVEILGKSGVELDRVGWVDPEDNKFYKDPTPTPLKEAGHHIVKGLIEMGDPSPQPSIEAGMAHFDQTYASLVELYAG